MNYLIYRNLFQQLVELFHMIITFYEIFMRSIHENYLYNIF
jgi:hypothetical protein